MKNANILCRLFSTLLVVTLLLSTTSAYPLIATATTAEFAGGSGTQEAPYLIATKEHLNNVRNHLDAHYKMIADIEFTNDDFAEEGVFYNSGYSWQPIGNSSAPFTGTIDGNDKTISGLLITSQSETTAHIGLLGFCRNANIFGLNVTDSKIEISGATSTIHAGLLCGRINKSMLSNCSVSGRISVITTAIISNEPQGEIVAGGIVGYSCESTIKYCSNQADILTQSHVFTYAGGISGYDLGYNNKTGKIS